MITTIENLHWSRHGMTKSGLKLIVHRV